MPAIVGIFLILGSLTGCSPIYDLSYDYDETADLYRLSTYDWMPIAEEAQINSLDQERIKEAVNAELTFKGMFLDSENPDFLIAADIVTREKLQGRYVGYPYHYPYYYPYRAYSGFPAFDYYQYREGTFVLEFVEPSSGRLIWRGAASAELDRADTPEKRDRLIREAVSEILKNFPPL